MSETDRPDLPSMRDAHYWHVPRLIAAWLLAVVVGVLVTIFAGGAERFAWLAFAIGLCTLATFALQLGTAQRDGFITRTSFSVAGSVVIIAVIDLVGLLIR